MIAFLRDHLVEAAATFAGLIIAAIGLSLGQEQGWPGLAGSLLTILGAFLSAIAGSWSFGKASSRRSLTTQLEILRNQLATVAGEIGENLRYAGELSPETKLLFAKTEPAVSVLSTIVRDLGRLTGGELGPEGRAIVQARRDLAEIGKGLSVLKEEGIAILGDSSKFTQEQQKNMEIFLANLQNHVGDALEALDTERPKQATREKIAEIVECPNPQCGILIRVRIGNQAGDTAAAKCHNCGLAFNAHRSASGIFTRVPGDQIETRKTIEETIPCPNCSSDVTFAIGSLIGDSAHTRCGNCDVGFNVHRGVSGLFTRQPTKELKVNCPKCSNDIVARFPKDVEDGQIRFCFSCGAKAEISPIDGGLKLLSEKPILDAIAVSDGSIVCSQCQSPCSRVAETDDKVFSICYYCDQLAVADKEPNE